MPPYHDRGPLDRDSLTQQTECRLVDAGPLSNGRRESARWRGYWVRQERLGLHYDWRRYGRSLDSSRDQAISHSDYRTLDRFVEDVANRERSQDSQDPDEDSWSMHESQDDMDYQGVR